MMGKHLRASWLNTYVANCIYFGVGGASLAFTILGVSYDARTGDVAFLTLDPHYAGVDDLTIIQTKVT